MPKKQIRRFITGIYFTEDATSSEVSRFYLSFPAHERLEDVQERLSHVNFGRLREVARGPLGNDTVVVYELDAIGESDD